MAKQSIAKLDEIEAEAPAMAREQRDWWWWWRKRGVAPGSLEALLDSAVERLVLDPGEDAPIVLVGYDPETESWTDAALSPDEAPGDMMRRRSIVKWKRRFIVNTRSSVLRGCAVGSILCGPSQPP